MVLLVLAVVLIVVGLVLVLAEAFGPLPPAVALIVVGGVLLLIALLVGAVDGVDLHSSAGEFARSSWSRVV